MRRQHVDTEVTRFNDITGNPETFVRRNLGESVRWFRKKGGDLRKITKLGIAEQLEQDFSEEFGVEPLPLEVYS